MSSPSDAPACIQRIELPLPFELASVNVYLVQLAEGHLLIDCGMETDASFAALQTGMDALGLRWTDIRQILLTHMHPDHMGLSTKLLALTGAELLMHEVEARHLELITSAERRLPWVKQAFTDAGVPEAMQARIDSHFAVIRKNFHALVPDRLLSGGEELPFASGSLKIHWTPGHSPGHMCLYCREQKLLISGDLILEHITPNIAWHPADDTLADFLASLRGISDLDIDLILPSHGRPFRGHREWIDRTVAHHGARCDEIAGLLNVNPNNAYGLVGELWKRTLSPINYNFAVFEVLAHLVYMQRQGRVHQRRENGALTWYVSGLRDARLAQNLPSGS